MSEPEPPWIDRFAGLSALPAPLREELTAGARITTRRAGERLFGPGEEARDLYLLIEGDLQVRQTSAAGREVHLYQVHAGESCVLCSAAMLAHEDKPAEGVALTDLRAAAVPRALFDDLTARSETFRNFVFTQFSRRISDLFVIIDQLVFRRLDARLAETLLAQENDGAVRATHAQLAVDLGSAREVVSRLLADFARKGWVEPGRGTVRLLDRAALRRLAQSS